MYYGVINHEILKKTCIVITRPCDTKREATIEYEKNFDRLPLGVRIEMVGKKNEIINLNRVKPVLIHSGNYGTPLLYV